ncbi:MAG: four-helix bundle copper-binding protein [Myxococcaceae bacterium]
MSELDVCINACLECAMVCTACADACLAEEQREELIRCIRLDADCADLCGVTARVLSRQTEIDRRVVEGLLSACTQACALCADECARHAEHMEHCRVCEEACRACQEACGRLSAGADVVTETGADFTMLH